MSFASQEKTLENPDFQVRVRQSMVKTALSVVGETPADPPNTALDDKRHALGVAILENISTHEMTFRRAVVAGGTITEASIDADVEFMVVSVFDDIAGVTGAEAGA